MASKRETWFLAECEAANGEKRSIWVDREGVSIYLTSAGGGYGRHLCHTAVSTMDQVKAEIALVYGVTVTAIKMPYELAREANEAKNRPAS